MKKVLAVALTLCLCINVSFAFDPYADEEVEKKSYKKLYYGIALTLLGGFLAYDGFSKVEVDVSKPSVDYTTVLHSEWTHLTAEKNYELKSGYSFYQYSPEGEKISIEQNILYNNGNVDLKNITIEVRYKDSAGYIVDEASETHPHNGEVTSDGYHVATYHSKYDNDNVNPEDFPAPDSEKIICKNIDLAKGESFAWSDVWKYTTTGTNSPLGDERQHGEELTDPIGLHLGEDALTLMDIRVKLEKDQQYKPIYEKRNKSDIEGVGGIMIGLTGIYFLIDHFVDMHKFNAYARRHNLNLKIATASNEYKLMLQKRI